MSNDLDSDECRVLAKTHMASLVHAFKSLKSVMSPYVSSTQASGIASCSDALVREVLGRAAQDDVSLLTRWDAGFQPWDPNLN